MGDHELGTSSGPIDLPARRVMPELARRRHRPLTGTAGILLFVCLFLPAVRGCHEPVVPLEVPPFWAPYLYGLVFAAIALARTDRGLAAGVTMLRILAWLVLVGGCAMLVTFPPIGVIEVLLGILLFATIGWHAASERRIAATAIMIGAIGTAWFALWACLPDALIGSYLALASSIGVFLGGMVWLGELAVQPDPRVPRAVARRPGG